MRNLAIRISVQNGRITSRAILNQASRPRSAERSKRGTDLFREKWPLFKCREVAACSSRMPPPVPQHARDRERRQLPGALLSWRRVHGIRTSRPMRGRSVRTASWSKPASSSRPRSSGHFSAGRSALLELRVAAEAITPLTTLSAIRDEALKQTPRQRRGSPHWPHRCRRARNRKDRAMRSNVKASEHPLLHYLRSGLRPARTSSEKNCGCSHAAK